MNSIYNSQYKKEIEEFLEKGGIVITLAPQDNPIRISAKPKILEEEDEEIPDSDNIPNRKYLVF